MDLGVLVKKMRRPLVDYCREMHGVLNCVKMLACYKQYYWLPAGEYALCGIIRYIKVNGTSSAFRKVERGKFEAR